VNVHPLPTLNARAAGLQMKNFFSCMDSRSLARDAGRRFGHFFRPGKLFDSSILVGLTVIETRWLCLELHGDCDTHILTTKYSYFLPRYPDMRDVVSGRTLIQIKSHAQKVVKRDEAGDDIFAPLKANKSRIEALVNSKVDLSDKKSTKAQSTAAYNERPIAMHRTGTVNAPMHLLSSCTTKDDRFRFTVGGQQERPFAESTVFRATLGGSTVFGRGVSFAFSPAGELRHESDDESAIKDSSVSTISSKSNSTASDVSAVCVTPQRKDNQRVDVMAAEALCGLSGIVSRKKRKADPVFPYMVSP
jgi:hypothetical protein